MGALLGVGLSLGKRLIPKGISAIGSLAKSAIGAARKNPVGTAIGGAATVGTAIQVMRPVPPPPPIYSAAPQRSAPGPRQPQGTLRRFGQRLIPGGRTGRELTPYEGTEYDKIGRPVAVHVEMIERAYAPPGYVIVSMPDGTRVGVLKGVARSMGLWKGRPKPPITAGDARAIRRAASARKRVKRLAGNVGFTCKARGAC